MVGRNKATVTPLARILLVDDNHAGLMARRAVLEELGYATDGARDAGKAMEMFRGEHYDLVVTDFRMPGMDGVQLIGEMRGEKPGIPVILISGFVDALGLNEKTTGANAVIMKSANEVQQLIRTAGRLLKTPRKPVSTERRIAPKARKKAGSA
jgi:CheY-like chemotaxis protein